MKKVVNVTIGQTVFVIEEDAHAKLEKYLASVKRHFKEKDEVEEEILEDIEISFAEKFLAKRKKKEMAITLEQVEGAIGEMGTVKELAGGEDGVEEEKDVVKKFYRDPDDVILGGVASGVGAYFGVDTMLVRLAFFAAIFLGGAGFFLYIVLWIFAPFAETKSHKYQMRGERLTLDKIEDSLKKGRARLKKKDLKGIRGVFDGIFRAVGKVVMFVLDFLRIVIGLAFSVAGIAGISSLGFGLAVIIGGGDALLFDLPVNVLFEQFGLVEFYLFWVVTFVIAVVPLIFVLNIGLSLLKKKNLFSITRVTLLIILWFVALGVMTGLGLDLALALS